MGVVVESFLEKLVGHGNSATVLILFRTLRISGGTGMETGS